MGDLPQLELDPFQPFDPQNLIVPNVHPVPIGAFPTKPNVKPAIAPRKIVIRLAREGGKRNLGAHPTIDDKPIAGALGIGLDIKDSLSILFKGIHFNLFLLKIVLINFVRSHDRRRAAGRGKGLAIKIEKIIHLIELVEGRKIPDLREKNNRVFTLIRERANKRSKQKNRF